MLHLHEISRIDKFIKTESKWEAAKDGQKRMGKLWLNDFCWGDERTLETWQCKRD